MEDRHASMDARGWRTRIGVGAVIVALGGTGAWWWLANPGLVEVAVASVRQTTADDGRPAVLNASGYVTARRRATVSSKVTGKVVEVVVEEGMVVRQGQILARLDDSTERSQLALAEAQLGAAQGALRELEVRQREAELTLGRRRELVAEGVISQAELDTAQAEFDSLGARIFHTRQDIVVAERQIDVRRNALADTVIRAPFAGVAISKDAQPGEMISPVSAGGGFTRTGIGTIVDMTSLEIEVDVNESYINRVSPAQEVVATLDAYPEWDIPASVITTIPAADRQRATVLVRIAFDELDPRILPDMGVNVAFLEADPSTGDSGDGSRSVRLWVPSAAVRRLDGASFVFVVSGETLERRAVTVGSDDGDSVEALAGLRQGEQVVVDGPPALMGGERVTIIGRG